MVNAEIAAIRDLAAAGRAEGPRAALRFGLLSAVVLFAFRDAAGSMASIWFSSSVYHHGLAVPLISLWLIRRREIGRRLEPAADWTGLAIVAAASLLWLIGRAATADILGHVAIAVALIGAVVAVFGREIAQRWSFALAFLFFMVPFGEELTPTLQSWATSAVAAALNGAGVETSRDGFMLTTGAGRFEMAESCAGLRFLLAAAMISSLVSGLAFAHWRKRVAFVALALAFALVANWVRAFLLVYLATITERKIGVGPEHVAMGWAFYGVLLMGLIAVAHKFSDGATGRETAIARRRRPVRALPVIIACSAIISAVALYDAAIVSSTNLHVTPRHPASLVPAEYSATGAAPRWRAFAPQADHVSTGVYAAGTNAVTLSAATFFADRPGAEIAGALTRAADGDEWRRIAISTEIVELGGAPRAIRVETLENAFGAALDVATIYRLGDELIASRVALKARIAIRKLFGASSEGGAIFIAAAHDGDRSRQTLRRFIGAMEP